MTISTIDQLRDHLQTAVEIEWSTIPPYLCARWSISEDPRNALAASFIDDVVMEEMLHLTLVCNLLNAVGGEPALIPPKGKPPRYPGYLPHSNDAFLINLAPFSPDALETFRRIERPAPVGAPPEDEAYETIAQFYEAVIAGLEQLAGREKIFTGKRERQVDSSHYYGGGGEVLPVWDLESARTALDVIVFEGEGINQSIWDGDHELLGEGKELAHYFRFNELHLGRRYQGKDTPSTGPTGDPLLIDYTTVLPMRPNPRAEDYPAGSELRELTEESNVTYSTLLRQLHSAFNGNPRELGESVRTMLTLRSQAVGLMRVPVGDGQTAGPAFQYRDPR
jgi:Ferritin-like